jgi:hypothetical protein
MKKSMLLGLLTCCLLVYGGCARNYFSDNYNYTDNPYLDLHLKTADYISYEITIVNKSDQDVEIIWEKTLYIDENNTTNDGFMFGDEFYYEDRNRPKTISIVFPKSSVTKTIYPAHLAYWRRGWWRNSFLPSGKSGVYLTAKVRNEFITHRLYINVSYEDVNDTRTFWQKLFSSNQKKANVQPVTSGIQ